MTGVSPEQPNFEGHQPRNCGEHRTVGPHRAWCYDCSEWCYPGDDGECFGCRIPKMEAKIAAQAEQIERLAAEVAKWKGSRLCSTHFAGLDDADYGSGNGVCVICTVNRAEAAEAALAAEREKVARVEALCDDGVFNVREWGERGTPFSNGGEQAFRRIRAALSTQEDSSNG